METLTQHLKFFPVEECAVCGGRRFGHAYTRNFLDREFQWTRCLDCRLLFQNPKLSRDSLNSIYNSDFYWQDDEKSDDGRRMGYKDYQQDDVFRLQLGSERIKELARRLRPGAHILDIGCATGFFLKNAHDLGFTGLGVELSADMARYGKDHYGVDIAVGDFEEIDLQPESFDAVTFWGCDSNFYDPRQTFLRAYRLLKPGGYLYFNFWDFDHFLRPLLLRDNKILYNSLFCFNRNNIRILMEKTGFKPLSMKGEWRRVSVDSILAWTGHLQLLLLLRRLGLSKIPIWAPALTGYLVLAQKL